MAELLAAGTHADEPSLEAMKKRFSTHGFEMTPNNLRQVRVPNGAQALPNAAGIAPGFVVRLGGAEAFFLPGVPREMEKIFTDEVVPRLKRQLAEAGVPAPSTRTWHLYGMGESHIDHRLAGVLTGVEGATLHFRTSMPVNHVKLVVRGANADDARVTLDKVDGEIRKRIGPGIYGVDGESFVGAVSKSLRAQEATLAFAESCTGGLAGELATSESGATAFFRGSVVAYADEMKTGVLGSSPRRSPTSARSASRRRARWPRGPSGSAARRWRWPSPAWPVPKGARPTSRSAPSASPSAARGRRAPRPSSSRAAASGCGRPPPTTRWIWRGATSTHASDDGRRAHRIRPDDPQLRGGAVAGAVRTNVFAAARELARALPQKGVKWSRKIENLHVTIEFLGPVEETKLAGFGEALAASLQALPPFGMEVRGMGAFPSPGQANVLWAGVADGGRLGGPGGRGRWEEAAARLGIGARSNRPFRAHVTVGRSKQGVDARAALAPFVDACVRGGFRGRERWFSRVGSAAGRTASAPPTSCRAQGRARLYRLLPTDQEETHGDH